MNGLEVNLEGGLEEDPEGFFGLAEVENKSFFAAEMLFLYDMVD